MTTATMRLAERWIDALKSDVSKVREICAPDCRLWHSSDNVWMEQRPALDAFIAAQAAGMIPAFEEAKAIATAEGFLVQTSVTMPKIGRIHVLQLVTVKGGKIAVIEEYIGPEMDLAAKLAAA